MQLVEMGLDPGEGVCAEAGAMSFNDFLKMILNCFILSSFHSLT
jgi:hypothetical protein